MSFLSHEFLSNIVFPLNSNASKISRSGSLEKFFFQALKLLEISSLRISGHIERARKFLVPEFLGIFEDEEKRMLEPKFSRLVTIKKLCLCG